MLTALTPWILVGGAAAGGQPGGTYIEEFGDGFEDGTGAAWTSIANSPQFNTDNPRSGSYAFNIDTIATLPTCRIDTTAADEVFHRFYIYLASTDMANGRFIRLLRVNNNWTTKTDLGIVNDAGTIRLQGRWLGTGDVRGGEVTLGAWHRLECHYKKESSEGANDGIWQIKLNGTLAIDFQDSPHVEQINRTIFGHNESWDTYNIELYLDDFSVGTGGWPGGDGGG